MPPTAKSARRTAQAERDEFVRRFRVHHLLQSFAMVHFGLEESRWVGDATRGVLVNSNNGDHHAVAWNLDGFVALGWDKHGYPLVRHPKGVHARAVLKDLPEALEPLVDELAKVKGPFKITATRWFEVTAKGSKQARSAMESEQLDEYDLPFDELMDRWRHIMSVTEAQAKLALALAELGIGARHPITLEEEQTLFTRQNPHNERPLEAKNVARAVRMLEQAGVDWPAAVERAPSYRGDDADQGYALVDAVKAGDKAAVGALLAAGANWRKYAGGATPGTKTPLIEAAAGNHREILELLFDHAGDALTYADLQHTLGAAVAAARREMCDFLIARGASPIGMDAPAIQSGRTEAIELALELGSATPLPENWYKRLRRVCLEANRPDLLERWPGSAEMEALTAADRKT